jgi:ankyrin repeat protein
VLDLEKKVKELTDALSFATFNGDNSIHYAARNKDIPLLKLLFNGVSDRVMNCYFEV